jgi:DNA (cytosine-5)-methyltransferase 1
VCVGCECTDGRMDRFVVRQKRARVDDGRPTVVELFAGAGGMAIGLERCGLRHVALVEWDKHCVTTLRRNGFKNVIHRNANHVDYTEFHGADVVAGGPPCQPFSIAGVHEGSSDMRDGWPAAIRAVEQIQPRGFMFENVTGLLRDKFKGYLDTILERFYALGYSVHVHGIDAVDYGVPQHRRRVLLIGIRGVSWFQRPACVENQVTLRQALQGLGEPNGRNNHTLHTAEARAYKGHTANSLDAPSKALVAGVHGQSGGTGVVELDDGALRYMTPREQARVQTFPDNYSLPTTWSHAVKQLGNACPPLLVERFAAELLYRLGRIDAHKAPRPASPSLQRSPGPIGEE